MTKNVVGEIFAVPLKNLVISPKNARTVPANPQADKELEASIQAHGILQNLIVIPTKKKNVFEVTGGGRRLGRLQNLWKQKKITGDYPVPCKLSDEKTATAVSLSENLKASMHPADEFMAYAKMAEEGKSPKEIALEFGQTTKRVNQLLQLASVAPELIAKFRENKLELSEVIAFSVVNDHEKQLACWKHFSGKHISAHLIKDYLLNNTIRSNDCRVKLIGLAAYKKAGGSITQDLFDSVCYLNDVDLVNRLATEVLEKKRAEVEKEGWKWTEVSFSGMNVQYEYKRLTAELSGVPKKLKTAYEKAQAELEAFEDRDFDDWTEEDSAKETELQDRVEELEAQQEQYRAFTAEQKSVSGSIVTLSHEGTVIVLQGLVRKGDEKAASKVERGEDQPDFTRSAENPALPEGPESNALRADLNTYFAQAVQAELLKHEELALDILVFTMACNVTNESYFDRMLDIRATPQPFQAVGIEDTEAHKQLNEAYAGLNLQWQVHEDIGQRFEAFCKLTKREKMKIMSFCVARTAMPSVRQDSAFAHVVKAVQFQLANYWTPTKENYFSRLKKSDLLDLGGREIGEDWKTSYSKSPKGKLVDLLADEPKLKGWMPDYLKS